MKLFALLVLFALVVVAVVAACGSSSQRATQPAPSATQPETSAAQPGPAHPHAHHDMHHRFEKADQWAPIFDDPKRDEWQRPDAVVAALALSPGMIVADIGAGTGYFEKRLATAVGANGKVIAIDLEADMVRYLGERAKREATPNVEPRLATADDPKLAAASVDRILIVDTWHHISNRVAYAKLLAAALKPGGAVYVVDFTLETAKGPPKQHRLAATQVIEELAQVGLRASVVDAGLPDQYMVKAAR
jgi:ubiquinone/menaquinone biosynthesis C-methylase UbiE